MSSGVFVLFPKPTFDGKHRFPYRKYMYIIMRATSPFHSSPGYHPAEFVPSIGSEYISEVAPELPLASENFRFPLDEFLCTSAGLK